MCVREEEARRKRGGRHEEARRKRGGSEEEGSRKGGGRQEEKFFEKNCENVWSVKNKYLPLQRIPNLTT